MAPPEGEKEQHTSTARSDRGSWLEVVTATINNHLQTFRALPWVMGGVGALLIIRTLLGCPTMQFVRYPTAADIPSHLITRGVTLRGVAIATKSDGCLEVWHTPPGRRWLRWKLVPPKPHAADQVLKVRLAALSIQRPQSVDSWIVSNLIGRSLRLHLVHYSSTDDCLHSIIKYRKKKFRSLFCANVELLSLGLATLEEPSCGCHGDKGSPGGNERLIAFLSEGVRAESVAQRRGRGVWRGSVHEARWRRMGRSLRFKN